MEGGKRGGGDILDPNVTILRPLAAAEFAV